ncbi:MAG TPA: DMT family transporter [Gaiellaceae bacterium]
MSGSAFAVVLSLIAGLAGAAQVAINGAFGDRIGVLEATAFNSFVAAILIGVVVLLAGGGVGGVVSGFREPAWLWVGGIAGAFIVTTITFAGPRIGSLATIALLIAGQLVMGVVIDAYGLFGVDKIPFVWTRLVGIALLAGGALLVLKR